MVHVVAVVPVDIGAVLDMEDIGMRKAIVGKSDRTVINSVIGRRYIAVEGVVDSVSFGCVYADVERVFIDSASRQDADILRCNNAAGYWTQCNKYGQ